MDEIVLEQICQVAELSAIVHRHHLDVRQGQRPTQDHTANTPKTVNADATCHKPSSL